MSMGKYIYLDNRYLLHSERFFVNTDISVSSIMNRIYLCMACMIFLFVDIDFYSWINIPMWNTIGISFDIFYIILIFYFFFSLYLHIIHSTFKLSVFYIFKTYVFRSNFLLFICKYYLKSKKFSLHLSSFIYSFVFIIIFYYFGIVFIDYLKYNVLEKYFITMNVRSLFSNLFGYENFLLVYFGRSANNCFITGNIFLALVDITTNSKVIYMLHDIFLYEVSIYFILVILLFCILYRPTIYTKNNILTKINNYICYYYNLLYFIYLRWILIFLFMILVVSFITISWYFINYYMVTYIHYSNVLNLISSYLSNKFILVFKYSEYIFYSLLGNKVYNDEIIWGFINTNRMSASCVADMTGHHMYFEFSDSASFYSYNHRGDIFNVYYLMCNCINLCSLYLYKYNEFFCYIFNIDKFTAAGFRSIGILDVIKFYYKVDHLNFFHFRPVYGKWHTLFDGEHLWMQNRVYDNYYIINVLNCSIICTNCKYFNLFRVKIFHKGLLSTLIVTCVFLVLLCSYYNNILVYR